MYVQNNADFPWNAKIHAMSGDFSRLNPNGKAEVSLPTRLEPRIPQFSKPAFHSGASFHRTPIGIARRSQYQRIISYRTERPRCPT